MNKLDKIFEKISFKRQKWLSENENKIVYENEKQTRFFILWKNIKAIEISSEHGFSTIIYPYEFPILVESMKELRWL